MQVIALSLDSQILDVQSTVAKRAIFYSSYLQKYVVVVTGLGQKTNLSSKCIVIPSGAKNKFLSILYIYKILNSELKTKQYQLLTIQDNYFLAVLGVYLAKKYKIKVEIQNHGFEKLTWWRRLLVLWSFKRADMIRTVSNRLFIFLQTEFKIDPTKIYTVPVPIEKEHLVSIPTKLDLHQKYPGKFIFLTVGRLVPVKNIALQFKALAALRDQTMILLVAGAGPEQANLKKLAKDLKIEQQIIFLGWQNNLADYYRTSDCLLLTSFSEGFPLVPSEAIIYDLPIIMTDVGSAGDLIENNVNGLVIPIGDQSALVEAMIKIKDINLRLNLKEGQKLACKKILDLKDVFAIIYKHWQKIIN